MILEKPAPTPEERQRQYEMFVEAAAIGNSVKVVKDITPEEIDAMHRSFENFINNPPAHYADFAARVFREEWRTNPRLFLDELLTCIRTAPRLAHQES